MRLDNLEKLKQLTAEIARKELHHYEEKKEIIEIAQRIYSMLDRPKINKQAIKEEFRSLMTKLSSNI